MTDVFRSEILAVVMQQIMDRPDLPVLFMRTVSEVVMFREPRGSPVQLAGYSSRHDIQISGRVRLDYPPLAINHQKDLGRPSIMGWIHPLC